MAIIELTIYLILIGRDFPRVCSCEQYAIDKQSEMARLPVIKIVDRNRATDLIRK
jgi:hypothetical protein